MTTDSADFEQATASLAALSIGLRSRLAGSTDDEAGELLRQVEQLGRLADSLRILSAADLAHRSRRELGTDGMAYKLGCARPVQLLEHLTLLSSSEAARRIRLGEAIRPAPAGSTTSTNRSGPQPCSKWRAREASPRSSSAHKARSSISAHHHMLHTSAFTMRMMRGKPELLAPPWLDPDQTWKPVGTTRALLRLAG